MSDKDGKNIKKKKKKKGFSKPTTWIGFSAQNVICDFCTRIKSWTGICRRQWDWKTSSCFRNSLIHFPTYEALKKLGVEEQYCHFWIYKS